MDTIYYNGDILTMERVPTVEAVLVRDGRIAWAGDTAAAMAASRGDCRRVDLRGAALLPAFIDSHSHITALAKTYLMVDLSSAKDFDTIIHKLAQFREENRVPEDQWICGYGYDQNRLREQRHPNRHVLDHAVPNPILISHVSGHAGVVSSTGLRRLDITADTPDPPGGKIGRIPSSREPDGYLEECAFTAIGGRVTQFSQAQMLTALERAQQEYLRYGITTVQDGLVRNDEWELLRGAAQAGRLLVDVVAYIDQQQSASLLAENLLWAEGYINHLRLGGYKLILDGSPQARTAWMSQPYSGDDGYRGYGAYTDAQIKTFFETVMEHSLQVLVHCNGDAAAEQMLSEWDFLADGFNLGLRPVMIHAQFVRPDQLERMARLGVVASFFAAHVERWSQVHRKNLGDARACNMSPAATAIRKGVVYTFHQDSPVLPPDMLRTVWTAVNRVDDGGRPVGPQERISVDDALRGVTINAAYQYFEEREKGSIRAGKKADLVILERDPRKAPPEKIKEIRVLETIKQGKTLYEAG